ncbi:hypothetical protein AB6A40_006964 [Gnathostoma spinigerum]|uniref:Uncharacterized protein n=1 Tax=Gnathostoma spinigerum TaxID=75299 RepID=A0ABD6EJV5_9BILA
MFGDGQYGWAPLYQLYSASVNKTTKGRSQAERTAYTAVRHTNATASLAFEPRCPRTLLLERSLREQCLRKFRSRQSSTHTFRIFLHMTITTPPEYHQFFIPFHSQYPSITKTPFRLSFPPLPPPPPPPFCNPFDQTIY